VVTSKALFGFDEATRRMKLLGVLKGLTRRDIRDEMEFEPLVANPLQVLEPPTKEELRILREEIDPSGAVIGRRAK
jgi:glutaconate CoA-transferase subunit B